MTRAALLLLIGLLALAGCAAAPQVVVAPPPPAPPLLRQTIPNSALRCAAEPAGGKVRSDRQAARYILALKAAGRDCRAKLGFARDLIAHEGEQGP